MNDYDEPIEGQRKLSELEPVEEIPRIDLNTATVEELCQLPGIGPALAARIVNYRVEVRPFEEPVEITAVPGISETTYTRIADRLTVSPVEKGRVEAEETPLPELEPEAVEAGGVPLPEPEVTRAEEMPPSEPEVMEAGGLPTPRPALSPRGGGWVRLLVVGLMSAAAGAVLALLVLLMVNGTLDFRAATTRALQAEAFRVDKEIGRLNAGMDQLQGRLEAMQDLAPRLDEAQAGIQSLRKELGALGEELEAAQAALAALGDDLGAMKERAVAVDRQLATLSQGLEAVRQTTRRFDAFLNGLRELLYETQGPVPRPIPPLRQQPTPTPQPMVTVIPLATPTPSP